MHPIVERYVRTTDPVFLILESARTSDEPMVRTMGLLREAIGHHRPASEALAAARALPLDHPDPALTALFLGLWGSCAAQVGAEAELAGIIKRLEAMDLAGAPPEARVAPAILRGNLARLRGDIAEQERQLRRVVEVVPRRSPRRLSFVLELSAVLASLCRLPEIADELAPLAPGDSLYVRWMLPAYRLVQYAESGHPAEAEAQARLLAEAPWVAITYHEQYLAPARTLSALCSGRWAPGAAAPDAPTGTGWTAVVDHLLARRPAEALALARAEAAARPDEPLTDPHFRGFNLVRAELAAGNGAAARRLLQLRHERGVLHPLDALFEARADWLDGERARARERFAQARGEAERLRALGRLDLELRAACELSPTALMELAGGVAPRARRSERPAPETGAATPEGPLARLVGGSPAMATLRATIRRYAPSRAPVLITGETGTGKELVARALHEASPRAAEPFVAVNCGGIADTLLESELFGHARGAFTGATRARKGLFEAAGAGTLLLDEIGEITPRLQVVLLRALESGEIRPVGSDRARTAACRVVAATNADLDARVAAGTFRPDLLYRLRQLEIRLPPLRERTEDCAALAAHFLALGRAEGPPPVLDAALATALAREPWPGNVRELRLVVERMRLLSSDAARYDRDALERARPSRPVAAASAAAALPVPAAGPGAVGVAEVLARGRGGHRRRQRLAGLFDQARRLSRGEVMALLTVSPGTAQRDLEALAAEGLIEKVTPSASTRTHYYRLRASGPSPSA